MAWYLGIDTSNYTTSAALYLSGMGTVLQKKAPLPVKPGELGLRQSEALFHHTVQLPHVLDGLFQMAKDQTGSPVRIRGVGVSVRPRNVEGSYMPCFLAGKSAAHAAAASLNVPCWESSHQVGHILAAMFSAGRMDLTSRPFLAFHVSGGTTDLLRVFPEAGGEILKVEPYASSLDLKGGQAVDRVGLMLGLPFPCGPALERLALEADWNRKLAVRPVLKGRDCCLSGVENQCRSMLAKGEPPAEIARFCLLSIGEAVSAMADGARKELGAFPLLFAGGVMSCRPLQRMLSERFADSAFAEPSFSSDNAAGMAVFAALSGERNPVAASNALMEGAMRILQNEADTEEAGI